MASTVNIGIRISHEEACGIQLTALNFAAAWACRVHFKLLFSLLTKPLIHPETGGQVSGGAGGKE